MIESPVEIVRELGSFLSVEHMRSVRYDGKHVWIAFGDKLSDFDPANGKTLERSDVIAALILRSNTFPIHPKLNDRAQCIPIPDRSAAPFSGKRENCCTCLKKLLKKTTRALDFHEGLSAP